MLPTRVVASLSLLIAACHGLLPFPFPLPSPFPSSPSPPSRPPARPPARVAPIFDRVFSPILGEVGTIKFIEEQVNAFGGNLNAQIDFIHDTDHGVRICNREQVERDNDFSPDHGVCFGPGKCSSLQGVDVGFCPAPTPKTTCCKFDKRCDEQSSETVTYFKSDAASESEVLGVKSSEDRRPTDCSLHINARLGACQIRVDFLDFSLPPQDQTTGNCRVEAQLEIVNHIAAERTETLFLCGTNGGQHLYLPILEQDQLVEFKFTNQMSLMPYSWHLRITQVDCRSGVPEMRALRAPSGCLQYFTATSGLVASLNFDFKSPLSPGQEYAICFRQDGVCQLHLQDVHFDMGVGGFVAVFDAMDEVGDRMGRDRFDGTEFGLVIADRKPFIARVSTGDGGKGTGFLLQYAFVENEQC